MSVTGSTFKSRCRSEFRTYHGASTMPWSILFLKSLDNINITWFGAPPPLVECLNFEIVFLPRTPTSPAPSTYIYIYISLSCIIKQKNAVHFTLISALYCMHVCYSLYKNMYFMGNSMFDSTIIRRIWRDQEEYHALALLLSNLETHTHIS
jgi:hypothetical protein